MLRSNPEVRMPFSLQSQVYIIRLCPFPFPASSVSGTPCEEYTLPITSHAHTNSADAFFEGRHSIPSSGLSQKWFTT